MLVIYGKVHRKAAALLYEQRFPNRRVSAFLWHNVFAIRVICSLVVFLAGIVRVRRILDVKQEIFEIVVVQYLTP